MATSYSLREQQKKDYRKLADIPLPRIRATKRVDKLYQLEIIEEDATNGKVKVHYTGYGSDDDEWRDKEDIVVVESPKPGKILHVCLATLLCYNIIILHFIMYRYLQKSIVHSTCTMNWPTRSKLHSTLEPDLTWM